jgi:hypothetical protein
MLPTSVHLSHPAFLRVLDSETDDESGLTVARVEYRTNHPDYVGGVFTEVYNWTEDCLDEDYPTDDLDEALAEALVEFEDELGC